MADILRGLALPGSISWTQRRMSQVRASAWAWRWSISLCLAAVWTVRRVTIDLVSMFQTSVSKTLNLEHGRG